MLNIIVSIIIWGVIAFSLCRVLYFGGVPIRGGKVVDWLFQPSRSYEPYKVTKKEIAGVALEAFLFRLAIYIISMLVVKIFMDEGIALSIDNLKSYWSQWDANHYIKIATQGYSGSIEDGKHLFLVFFPLYPWIMRAFNYVFNNIYISGFVVSNLCYILGCCFLFAGVSLEYGKNIAKKAVIYISIFPFAFFFGSMMTESLFFLLIAACFYFIKLHKWWMVAFIGILASLTRMMGVLLILPAFLEWVEYYKPFAMIREKRWKELWKVFYSKLMWVPFMVIGPLIYLYINYVVEQDPFRFLFYQRTHWYQQGQYFGKTFHDIWERAFGSGMPDITRGAVWIPAALIFIFTMLVLVYAVRRHQSKYVLYLAVYLILNYAPTWLLSAGRYMSVAVPMFIIMAEFSEKHPRADKWITAISSILFGLYMIGYLMGKQIM